MTVVSPRKLNSESIMKWLCMYAANIGSVVYLE